MSETPIDPSPHRSAPRATLLRIVTVIVGIAAIVLATLRVGRDDDAAAAAIHVAPSAVLPPEPSTLEGRQHLVADPVLGVSPAPSVARRVGVTPLAGGAAAEATIRRDRLGMLRAGDLPDPIPGPRILLLGDEAIATGVTTGDDLGSLVEAGLRARGGGLATATTLNAATPGDGLAAYALRARRLVPVLRPSLVVVCIDPADDIVALADRSRPHVAVSGELAPPAPDAPADPLGLALFGDAPNAPLLRRTLGHPMWLMTNPTRATALDANLREALRALRTTAPRDGTALLLVVLPNADALAPAAFEAAAGDAARPFLAQGGSTRARTALTTAIRDLGFAWIDATDGPSADSGDPAAWFTSTGLLTAPAHRELAARLVERIAQRLAAL